MRYSLLLIVFIVFLHSCKKPNDEKYFYRLTKEIEKVSRNKDSIKKIIVRESKKYVESNDMKFDLAKQYTQLFLFSDKYQEQQTFENNIQQIPLVLKIKNINRDRYQFLSMACHLNLALKFEDASPVMAMKYVDSAIASCKKMPEPYFIGHLYHAKGRFYFKQNDLQNANKFFLCAYENYDENDLLYRASMYNNFALVQDKLRHVDRAIIHTENAIRLLKSKPVLTVDDVGFLHILERNLALYNYENGNKDRAESILGELFQIKKKTPPDDEMLTIIESLRKNYRRTKSTKSEELFNYLKKYENSLINVKDQIKLYEILLEYYIEYNDFQNLRGVASKLIILNKRFDQENATLLVKLSDTLNISLVKSLENSNNQKQIAIRNKYIIAIVMFVVFSIILILLLWIRKEKLKKIKETAAKDFEIQNREREILNQSLNLEKIKIQNLHHNLSIKIETEKKFLENLKKIKKNNNISGDELLKDIIFQVSNLIKVDTSNLETYSDNDENQQAFSRKLLEICPELTSKELKLCLYFRLNISTKEISILLNSTDGTIRVYKTKIKNKLKLSKDDDLTSFLKRLVIN